MSDRSLAGKVEQARGRLIALSESARAIPGPEPLVRRTLEEVNAALQELQAAADALREQNEELAAAHHAVERERQRYIDLFDFAPDGYLVTDTTALIREANRAATALLSCDTLFLRRKPLGVFLTEPQRGFADILQRLLRGETIREQEVLVRPRSGPPYPAALNATVLHSALGEAIEGVLWLVRDIRRRKEREEMLRRLTVSLLQAQDDERRRIARELHDSTSQNIAALLLHLGTLEQSSALDRREREDLAAAQGLAEEIERETRSLAYLLHPPMIDNMGLAASLRWLCDRFAARTSLAIHLDLDPEFDRLRPDVEIALYRVVQECLANIKRHARATTARIRLARDTDAIVLEVEDDGQGCGEVQRPESEEPCSAGIGVIGMRERLRDLGGQLEFVRRPGGTRILATLPLAAVVRPPAP